MFLFRSSFLAANRVSKQFVITLAMGIVFGFSFAYMVLNMSPYNNTNPDSNYLLDLTQPLTISARGAHSHGMVANDGPDEPLEFHDQWTHAGEIKNWRIIHVGISGDLKI